MASAAIGDFGVQMGRLKTLNHANFPVLGDAEIVAACAYEEIITVEAGSIDTKAAQGKIVGIMEGGKEAFKRRKTIYEIWAAAAGA